MTKVYFFETSENTLVFTSQSTNKEDAINEFFSSYERDENLLYNLKRCETSKRWEFHAIEYRTHEGIFKQLVSYEI